MSGPEAIIEKHLKKEVEKAGGMCIKFTGQKDVPDRVVILNGITAFVEVKAPGVKPRASQKRMFGKMYDAGAIVFVLDSKEGVTEILRFMRLAEDPLVGVRPN